MVENLFPHPDPLLTGAVHLFNILLRASQNIRRRFYGAGPNPLLTRLGRFWRRSAKNMPATFDSPRKDAQASLLIPHIFKKRARRVF